MYHNDLSYVLDRDRQLIDVLDENNHPFPLSVPRLERKAFAMLTPDPEDLKKMVTKGRTGQNLLRVSKDAKVTYVSSTAWEWERVMSF